MNADTTAMIWLLSILVLIGGLMVFMLLGILRIHKHMKLSEALTQDIRSLQHRLDEHISKFTK